MTNLVPESVRKLLSEYTFETEDNALHEELMCTVCHKLMTDVYQTSCGCKYCRECIIMYISEGNEYCPGDKEDCREVSLVFDENVSRMPQLNKKILRVKVHCPNNPCVFLSPLTSMEDHLRVCDHQPMECPFTKIGCGSEPSSRERIQTHLQNEGTAHSGLLVEVIDNLRNEIGILKEEVASLREESSLIEDTRLEMLERIAEERRLREDDTEIQLRDMQMLIDDETQYRIDDKAEIMALMKKQKKKMMEKLAQQKREMMIEINNQRKNLRRKVEPDEETEAVVAKKKLKKLEFLPMTMDSLNMNASDGNRLGRLLFPVKLFREKMTRESVFSPYFYSKEAGYKLRLRVYPGGLPGTKRRHLSAFAVICKGEYDEELSWPFKHHVDISIINQRTNEAYRTDTISYCMVFHQYFKYPISADNDGLGQPSLVSHLELESIDDLLVSDTVLLLATVRPPPTRKLAFKVDRLSERRAANEIVYSPYFYSREGGYKLRLRVHPGGCGRGRGTHLSVGLTVCAGDDDDGLPWPFRGSVTVAVVNKVTNESHTAVTFNYCAKYADYFKKPINAENDVFMMSAFVPLTDLYDINGVRDTDSVSFMVSIDNSQPL